MKLGIWMRGLALLLVTFLVLTIPQFPARAAEPVYLFLEINGEPVVGDVSRRGLEGAIECLSYEQGVTVPSDRGGLAVARRQYSPIRLIKRIDRTSPILLQALNQNRPIDASFRFYRPTEKNAIEQFYTVSVVQARISSVRQYLPDVMNVASGDRPPLEEISISYGQISWRYALEDIEAEDAVTLR